MVNDGNAVRPSILIVDDEFGLAEMLRELLIEVGFDVSIAINGRLALRVLQDHAVDLVLSDVMMPVMDGPELAHALRNDQRYCNLPIVFMTSLDTAIPSTRGLYDAMLEKPFTPEQLLHVLDELKVSPHHGDGAAS